MKEGEKQVELFIDYSFAVKNGLRGNLLLALHHFSKAFVSQLSINKPNDIPAESVAIRRRRLKVSLFLGWSNSISKLLTISATF